MIRSILLVLAFTPVLISAQDPIPIAAARFFSPPTFYDPDNPTPPFTTADSLALEAFKTAMQNEVHSDKAPAPAEGYRLVWYEQREGWQYMLMRGDGGQLSAMLTEQGAITGLWAMGPAYFGDRYAVITDNPPTGLVRYTIWYFERTKGAH